MTDRDYAPLSAATVRSLNDKLYEKRKVAALEIERMVKDYVSHNNTGHIRRLLKVLGQDFALSQNPNSRKGGLIGLAATAIALGKESSNYVQELVKPVLTCFYDSDSRVRYYGCESLYNIVKVARGSVLPFFNEIFDGLSKLAADPDQNVRSGSELLDRLMKDIVTESCAFDMVAFMPLIRERIYTKNPFARQFIVSWVATLDAVPDIDMLVYLPEILDGLFLILGDVNPEIRKMCEATLGEFLRGIGKVGKDKERLNYPDMVNILITQSQSSDHVIQYTAITWLKEFISQSGRMMLPFTSGMLTAVMPCLSYDEEGKKNIREAARAVNSGLMRMVDTSDDSSPSSDSEPTLPPADEKTESSQNQASPATTGVFDVSSVIAVLQRLLMHDSMQTRIAALRWIYHLYIKTPNKIFMHVEESFPLLLKTLSDPSDEVVLLDLEVLAEISSSPAGQKYQPREVPHELPPEMAKAVQCSHEMNGYFTMFMVSLMKLFSTDRQLLEDRGSFIIRQLCLLLNAEDIYRCCSLILLHEKDDMKFASHMIQTLSSILLTSTELFELRSQLKDLKTKESCSLFCCLYKAWCHHPVSTVALCLLTQNYQHACHILTMFGDLEVTVDFLTELDKLVQLIESPIFTYLRLQLLDVQHNQHLIKSLYGLLMLLPQSDAFRTLQHRLECIPNVQCMPPEERKSVNVTSPAKRETLKHIKFDELLSHFRTVQERHRAARRQPRTIQDVEQKKIS